MPEPEPHWNGHRGRLRARLMKRGAGALDDYEILEALLVAFIPRRDVKPVAKALEKKVGGLSVILAAPAEELVKVDGVGEMLAAYLKAVAEMNSRVAREQVKAPEAISSWSMLVEYVRREIQHETREQFRVLFLDRKNQLILDEIRGRDPVDHAPVYPREIARRALEGQCSRLILVHSHQTRRISIPLDHA